MCRNFVIWGAHFVEMFVAVYLCRSKGEHSPVNEKQCEVCAGIENPTYIRLWTLQTMIMGVFSIKLLLEYEPETREVTDEAVKKAN